LLGIIIIFAGFMKQDYVTIKDIAKKLNLSASTVSRALRNLPEINEETRKRVASEAKSMNYHPNLLAQSLRNRQSNTIGVVVPDLELHFFSSCISGMQEACLKKGYNLIISQSKESFELENHNIITLLNSRVDGVLISLSRETNSFGHLKQLTANNIPFVYFDRVNETDSISKVVINDQESAYEATNYLIKKGYRKIAFLEGPKNLSISKNRLAGYRLALQDHNLNPKEEWILETDLSKNATISCLNNLLALVELPDAILAINDTVAIDCILHLKKLGVRIPEDIAVMGFTNSPAAEIVEPNLTTVEQPSFEMGKLAALSLLEEIKSSGVMPHKVFTLKTKIIERQST
jgi:LacI family transcriptional regulator